MKTTQKRYSRFSSQEKIDIILQLKNGKSISEAAREHGISRTILYKWLKKFNSAGKRVSVKTLSNFQEKGMKHWRKLEPEKEREVVDIWRENKNYSIRKIADEAQISTGAVWKIVNKYKIETLKTGRKKQSRLKKRYNILSENEKLLFIKRFEKGEKIAPLSREASVSRTIFYTWIRKYKENGRSEKAVARSYSRNEDHWRFMPGLESLILQAVKKNPNYSLAKIRKELIKDGRYVSRSGLYYMLKRLNYPGFSSGLPDINGRYRDNFEISRFLLFSFMVLFSGLIFIFSYNINFVQLATKNTNFEFNTGFEDNGWKKFIPVKRLVQQDLSWGAFAVNTIKSFYSDNEDVQIGFGVVDSLGQTVCDAGIDLNISNQDKEFANAKSLEVVKSSECGLQTVTNVADYQATSSGLVRNGVHSMNIRVNNNGTEKQFNDQILVVDKVPFEVARVSFPTRIYPKGIYPVVISVIANRDFIGEVSDFIPSGIKPSRASGGGVVFRNSNDNSNIIKWEVNMKTGQEYTLRYNLRFEELYPAFYEIGPMKFEERLTGELVFREARYWQVVADSL